MTATEVRVEPSPVLLYFDPHPVHEKMAAHVGAELVACETGGPLDRIRAGANHSFDDRPVILEGGVPLLEGAATKLLGECGPVVALGADSTYDDIADPLPNRSAASRVAHRAGLKAIDGSLVVSERIATLSDAYASGPVRITHPFVTDDRFERLRALDTDPTGDRVLCVGKYRQKNGQDLLRSAVERTDRDVHVDFVGPDTEDIQPGERVETHGFVSTDRLYELFESASLVVFPAPVGAFPVATLEGLAAGLPVVVTPRVGTATLVRGVHGRLVADPTAADLARAIDWYFVLSDGQRRDIADRARQLGAGFREDTGLDAFGFEFARLLDDIGFEGRIHD